MPGPLIAWGTPEVLNAAPWSASNVTLTAGASDPFGGNAAYLAADSSGASSGQVTRAVTVAPGGGPQTFVVWFAQGSAPSARVILISNVGALTVGVGAAAAVDAGVTLSRRWFAVVIQTTALVPGNAHAIELYPDGSGAGGTGASYFYLRPTWTHYLPLDDAIAAPRTRLPSELVVLPSGVRDGWNFGQDYVLNGVLRRVPPDASTALGEESSGYYGNGADLVGVGLQSLLIAGARPSVLRYCRDRANASAFVDAYLEAPIGDVTAANEPDATIRQPITLVSTSPFRGVR
jgi:hypothetical protein